VGVPLRFAKVLSHRVGVTPWNAALMRALVTNGPRVWPGATHVEDEGGNVTDLSTLSRSKREKIARELLTPSAAVVAASAAGRGAPSAAAAAATSAAGGVSGAGITLLSSSAAASGGAGAASAAPTAAVAASGSSVSVTSSASAPVVDLDPGAMGAAASAGGRGPGGVGIKRVWRHLLDDDIVLMNRQVREQERERARERHCAPVRGAVRVVWRSTAAAPPPSHAPRAHHYSPPPFYRPRYRSPRCTSRPSWRTACA
jgi:hypothetical protein